MAQHAGYVGISAVSAGPIDAFVQVDSTRPPQAHRDAYLQLVVAGAAAEVVLCGTQLTNQLQLKREDFSLDQDVVKFLVAWNHGQLLYPGSSVQGLSLDQLWTEYQTMAFRSAWTQALKASEGLLRGTLNAPLVKTKTFLQQQWQQRPSTPTKHKIIDAATLQPYLA